MSIHHPKDTQKEKKRNRGERTEEGRADREVMKRERKRG